MPPEPTPPGREWAGTAVRLGCDPRVAGRTGDDLESRHAEPHRRYHTGVHVQAVVADAHELGTWLHLDPHEQDLLVAAACAHDVVYAARPGEDERASARWAVQALTDGGVAAGAAARVGELILMTATHDAPHGDHGAESLLDADLAILAAPPDRYARYVADVRAEYGHVSDADWVFGRAAVLRGLVDRPTVYRSSRARQLWESDARANVAAELAELPGLPGPAELPESVEPAEPLEPA